MKINTLEIEQFKSLQNITIDFGKRTGSLGNRDYNLTVLIGENGSSKTTILQLIHDSFQESKESFVSDMEKMDLNFQFRLSFSVRNENYVIDSAKYENPQKNIKRVYVTNTLYDKVTENRSKNDSIAEFSQDIVTSYYTDGKLFDFFLGIDESFYGIQADVVYVEFRRLQTILGGLIKLAESEEYKTYIENSILNTISLEIEYRQGRQNIVKQLIKAFQREINYNSVQANRFKYKKKYNILPLDNDELFAIFEQLTYLLRLEKEINGSADYETDMIRTLWIKKGGVLIPLHEFSSGELSYITQLVSIKKNITDDSIILIDEPELNLHPKWIKGYLSKIDEICQSFNCHVIIATHNPILINNLVAEELVILKMNQGNLRQITHDENPTAISLDDVLNDVFSVNSQDTTYLKKLSRDISQKITSGVREKELEGILMYDSLEDSYFKFNLFRSCKNDIIRIKDSQDDFI